MTVSSKKSLQAAISACGGQKEALRSFAREIVAGLSELDGLDGADPLDVFVSELVLSAADHRRLKERRQHQLECIAAAKARGVRFGRQRKTLPEDFDRCYRAWQDGELSLNAAAEACGMGKSAFRGAVQRRKQEQDAELSA